MDEQKLDSFIRTITANLAVMRSILIDARLVSEAEYQKRYERAQKSLLAEVGTEAVLEILDTDPDVQKN